MIHYDMNSHRSPKRYPGHVLRQLRAERGVGGPPKPQPQEEPAMKSPRLVQKIARRRGERITENMAETMVYLERFGQSYPVISPTRRALVERGLVSQKTGKLTKKARDILAAADHHLSTLP